MIDKTEPPAATGDGHLGYLPASFLCDRAAPPVLNARLVLAHGAGAAMDSDFMNSFARLAAGCGLEVVRFEFPYMAERRRSGKRRPPDRAPALLEHWRRVVAELGPGAPLFIGGKSLGGRMASMIADELNVTGLVCLGYPFHPPRKPQQLRTGHLLDLRTPALVVQGSRDPFGSRDEVCDYVRRGMLAETVRLQWLEDGDHDFKPRVKSGLSQASHLETAAQAVKAFVAEILSGPGKPS